MVCGNHMNLQDDVNQVIIHELIHAYDECRAANLNWSNRSHHACCEGYTCSIIKLVEDLCMGKPRILGGYPRLFSRS
ncbi:Peptidase M76, ATP23 [Dillenia turbinata]|uniref:Mitochondrial inner membrane protease ATP23 n=1 Tax=Dillenia turbinata TaxID=194707 RepID=A0AAN8ZAN1_9MAGN